MKNLLQSSLIILAALTLNHAANAQAIAPGQIIYSRAASNTTDNNAATVWAINADGTNDHQITFGSLPRISPDGRYLIFNRKYSTGGSPNLFASLWIRDMTTGAESLIYANNSDYITGYDFAPTGQNIFLDYGCVIVRMDYDGTNRQTIDNDCYQDAPVARKTDGLLAFHGYSGEIFTSDQNGNNKQAIPTTYGNNYSPAWSNDGQFVFYAHYDGSSPFPYTNDSLYKIKPDGTDKIALKTLTGADRFGAAGAASTDDTKIYMPAIIGGVTGIYAIATDGSGTISPPIAAGSNVNYVGGIAPAGLAAWFAGDGDARDNSGNNQGGTLAPAPRAPEFTIGKVGQAFNFTANGQYVSIPDSPAVRPQSLTIEGWANLTGTPSPVQSYFDKPLGTINQDSYAIWYQNGTLHAAICADGSSGYPSNVVQVDAPSFSLNTWHHVAMTFDDAGAGQTKTLKLYVDNAQVAGTTTMLAVGYDNSPANIGADYDSQIGDNHIGFSWQGAIDEVSLYNRALSAAEINSIYNAAVNGKIKNAATNAGANSQSIVNDATVTFANVTAAGTTIDYTIDPLSAGTLPANYANTGLAYDISTTAVYTGAITECFHLPAFTDATTFSKLSVLHLEGGTLADKTTTRDFAARTVCGQTASLSPFVIALNNAPTAASVTVSGRARTASGKGILGVRISMTDQNGAVRYAMTNSFGFYRFENVPAGETYILSASRKGYSFSHPTRVLSVTEDTNGVDFVAE